MKYLLLAVLLMSCGCAKISYNPTTNEFHYERWFNQSIGECMIELADGTEIYFDRQDASNQAYIITPAGTGSVK